MSNFSQRLNDAMKIRGVSQSWLAHHADTSEANISRYRHAVHDPGILTILPNIAKALNVSTDYFVGLCDFKSLDETQKLDEQVLVRIYSQMSKDDKEILWEILDKYLSESDRLKIKSI